MSLRSHMDVIEQALETAGMSVYRGIGPPSPTTAVPYVVLTVNDLALDGPVCDPHADYSPMVQVMAVGDTSNQAEWLDDKVRDVVLGTLTPPTGRVWLGPPTLINTTPTRPDLDTDPPLHYLASVYQLASTPI